jgi:hypothetical protein
MEIPTQSNHDSGVACSRRSGAECGDPVADALDVREVAQRLFAKAKESLQERGSWPPIGFILNATGEIEAVDLDAQDNTRRASTFASSARRRGARVP